MSVLRYQSPIHIADRYQTALQDSIESDALLSGALDLERIAYANNGNRATGSQGHNDTVTYLYNQLTSLGDYYNVTLQPWSAFVDLGGNITLTIDGTLVPARRFTFGPSGNVEGQIVPVGNLGCNAVSLYDFDFISGLLRCRYPGASC